TSTTYHTYDYADRFSTCYFLFRGYPDSRHRHSFPTRRSSDLRNPSDRKHVVCSIANLHRTSYVVLGWPALGFARVRDQMHMHTRSEEHTSELQSRENLVCRLLLEKKNTFVENRNKQD